MSQTLILESNREIAYAEQVKALGSNNLQTGVPPMPNNEWTTKIEGGIPISAGDQISVEACMINTRGSPEETIEFSGDTGNVNPLNTTDNGARMGIVFYTSNNHRFNCNYPLIDSVIKTEEGMGIDADWGFLDFSTYTNFKKNYPFRGIEGMYRTNAGHDPATYSEVAGGGVFTAPPTPADDISPFKYFLTNTDGTFKSFGEINNATLNLFERFVDLSIEKGFNTPTNVGQTLTQQLHQREGFSDNWANTLVDGFIVTAVDPAVQTARNPVITDMCLISVPSSTGDIFLGRANNRWGAKLPGEAGHDAEGTGYTEKQGRDMFFRNLLVGNITEFPASVLWNNCRFNNRVLKNFQPTQNNINNVGLLTGNTEINPPGITDSGIGELGQWPCIFDNLDFEVKTTSTNVPTGTDNVGNTNVDNMRCLKIPTRGLVTTNIIYNAPNLQRIAEAFRTAEIPTTGFNATTPNPSVNYTTNLAFGRANDQYSSGVDNRKMMTPMPKVRNLPNNDPNGSDNFPNSYVEAGGFKTLAGINSGSFDARHQLRFFTRWDERYDQGEDGHTGLFLPDNTTFQFKSNTGGRFPNYDLSREFDVAVIPVFKKPADFPAGNPDANNYQNIPFCAFINIDAITPNLPAPQGTHTIVVPYPTIGEYFGYSPSCYDNLIAKVVTTQKKGDGTNTYLNPATSSNNDPDKYMPYVMMGADNPTITFDDSYGRFTIKDFHTPLRPGNGTFQEPLDTTNEQSAQESMGVLTRISYISGVTANKVKVPYPNIAQTIIPHPVISAESGIALNSLFSKLNKPGTDEYMILLPTKPEAFKGTLFNKLGFTIEQLIPFVGQVQGEFNRGNYNQYLGEDVDLSFKFSNMVKPFTTNAYISGADALGMVKNQKGQNMENMGAIASDKPVFVNAESDELIALDLPAKLDYAYLIVYSDIVRNNVFYGGANGGSKIPAMAYISRNYSTGDFFYSFTTGWTYTADQDFILTSYKTQIMLPNGRPAPIDANSSVIYKISRPQALPPPPQQIVANNDPEDKHQKETYKADK
jgi:hypothetical protein